MGESKMAMRLGTPLPSFEGATEWIRGSAQEAEKEAKDQLTLVHFWAVSCGICKDNMPRVQELRDSLQDKGVRVIAVHMPRYEADTDLKAVREAVERMNITEICAVDNEHKLKEVFQNDHGWVPAYYLFNAEGQMKGFAAGEKGLDMIVPTLNRLLQAAQAQEAGS
jgi:thiol-disulfide isomerase/thioredoxin